MRKWAILLALVACTKAEHRDARVKYNEGVDLLVKEDFEKAEAALLDARSGAGVDPDLRFRAAYDLGMAYAAHAEKMKTGKDANLEKALELEQQAVSWFGDALRLRKDDADAKANLAIVKARAQALSDDLNKGAGKLEARLDAVIAEQRKVLDGARDAWVEIKQSGGTDPLAQQSTLVGLADTERGVIAEAGVIGDLASDEIDEIGKKPDDKRTDEEKGRVVQLKNLDLYLMEGRARIAEARRKLQDLAAEEGVDRAEAALVQLKRAREQLVDPITVMRDIAQDQLQLLQETHAVAEVEGPKKVLDMKADAQTQKPVVPAWMEPPAQADRQAGLHDRIEEVRARLAAAVEGAATPQGGEPPKMTPEQAKLMERVKVVVPLVTDASGAMTKAHDALATKDLAGAEQAERDALVALAKAIEQFGDLKQTIELAYQTQHQLVTQLPEAAKHAQEIKDGLAANLARMPRIKELISDQVVALEAKKADKDEEKKQVEQMKQMLQQAETLRGDAEQALAAMDAAIKATKDPVPPAKDADAKLAELRTLFFSVIEHLQELIRQQGETRDQTSQASGEDDFTRAPKLPGLVQREDGHSQMAKAITDALAKQADAGKGQQGGEDQAKSFAAAADEVRLADNDMQEAKTAIGKAQAATNQTITLKPAVDSEGKALEHLQNALRLLQPPQQQNQDQKKDQQQQQQQAQKDKDKKDQQQQPQGGAGQRARDEDAKRQRDRQKSQTEPVDKDW